MSVTARFKHNKHTRTYTHIHTPRTMHTHRQYLLLLFFFLFAWLCCVVVLLVFVCYFCINKVAPVVELHLQQGAQMGF